MRDASGGATTLHAMDCDATSSALAPGLPPISSRDRCCPRRLGQAHMCTLYKCILTRPNANGTFPKRVSKDAGIAGASHLARGSTEYLGSTVKYSIKGYI